MVRSHGKHIHFLLFPIDLQLFNGCRPVDIAGGQKRFLALQLQLSGDFRRGGGLTCALEPGHHNHRDGFPRLHGDLCGLASH